MKVKLKSANAVTRFLLAHGEKLGMAAVLAVAFLLIWKSLGRARLEPDKQPPRLIASADNATKHYEEMSWEKIKEKDPAEVVDVGAFAATAGDGVMQPVEPKAFPLIGSINPRVTDPIGLRTDPDLLAPEKLEVHSGSGLWAWSDPETIKKKALEALEKAQKQANEDAEEARRMEDEQNGRRRGGRGGRGDGYRGEGARGGYGGGMGGLEMTADNVAVVRPANAAGGQGFEDIRGVSWVTVLAKVPIKDQVEKYEDSLATVRGYDPQSDLPSYIGYQVQRAEITEEGDAEWVTLPTVLKRTIINAMESRPFEIPELANDKYTHPLLTWPLPSMVLRPWNKNVTHSDLPIPTPEELMGGMDQDQPKAESEEKPDEEGLDDFAKQEKRNAAPQAAMQGEYGYAGRGIPGGYGGGFEMGRGVPGGYGDRGGIPGGYGGRGGIGMEMGGYGAMMGRGAGAYDNLPDKPWDGKTKYILFRYFDSTVKPGHRYRYRVRLALSDVNKDPIPEKYLDPTVVARKKEDKNKGYRTTDWSEPSPIAAVPQSGLIYVAKVNESKGFNEPEARLIVKALDARPNVVAEAAVAEDFMRGSVINLLKRKASIMWSTSFQTQNEDGELVQSPEFDLLTGVTLLDFTGGGELNKSRDLLAPARALVMDATGRMSIERELDQLKAIREYNYYETASRQAARNRQDDERGGRGGGGRRRGGF